jgi:hypothetical protein
MSAFATVQDLGSKWAHLTGDDLADVEAALEDASVMIRQAFRNAGRDLEAADPDVLRVVCARMVRQAFPPGSDDLSFPLGAESTQIGVGPFQRTIKFAGGGSGRLWLGPDERRELGLRAHKAFSVDMLPEGWSLP